MRPDTESMMVSLARFFDVQLNWVVPNVSYGMNIHDGEIDLLVVTKAQYAMEVEVKISRSDIRQDLNKRHCHKSSRLKCTYFAIPESLILSVDLIPSDFGIITVTEFGLCKYHRKAKVNKSAKKLTSDELIKLGKLTMMRLWNLKESNIKGKIKCR